MKRTQFIDPQYLAKLKRSGFTEQQIASRLGVEPEAVQEKWEELQKLGVLLTSSGYDELRAVHETACLQYQEMGKTLGRVGFALSNQVPPEELRGILDEASRAPDPVAFVLSHCIVLRSFSPDEVEKQMAEYVKAYRAEPPATSTETGASPT